MRPENTSKPEAIIKFPHKNRDLLSLWQQDKAGAGLGAACVGVRAAQVYENATLSRAIKPAAVTHEPVVRLFSKLTKGFAKKHKNAVKSKKRKTWFKDWAEDVFDLVKDIFD